MAPAAFLFTDKSCHPCWHLCEGVAVPEELCCVPLCVFLFTYLSAISCSPSRMEKEDFDGQDWSESVVRSGVELMTGYKGCLKALPYPNFKTAHKSSLLVSRRVARGRTRAINHSSMLSMAKSSRCLCISSVIFRLGSQRRRSSNRSTNFVISFSFVAPGFWFSMSDHCKEFHYNQSSFSLSVVENSFLKRFTR